MCDFMSYQGENLFNMYTHAKILSFIALCAVIFFKHNMELTIFLNSNFFYVLPSKLHLNDFLAS